MKTPLDFISDAPCYWLVPDDGALQKCAECNNYCASSNCYLILTPNANASILCLECIDEEWLEDANYLGFWSW